MMSRPVAFDMQLHFHAFMFYKMCMQTLVGTVQSLNSGMRLEHVFWVMMKAWNAGTQAAGVGSIQIAIQPYVFHKIHTILFKVIDSSEKEYARQFG